MPLMPLPNDSRRNRDRFRLALACGLIGLVWLVILPAVSRAPHMQARAKRFEKLGIDPGAKFYTEHPAAWEFLQQFDEKRSRNPETFWRISGPFGAMLGRQADPRRSE